MPLLVDANSDEGVSFSVDGLNNATAIFNSLVPWRSYALTPPGIRKLLELYPNAPIHELPTEILLTRYSKTTVWNGAGMQPLTAIWQ